MALITKRFLTTGMHCPSCSMVIQMDLAELEGVHSANVDHRSGMSEVTFDDSVIGPQAVVDAIVRAGYGAELLEP